MRKAMPYLGAAVSALAVAWSMPASAQDAAFKDLQQDHWAYQAVNELQQKGILEGYPDGFFRGKRTLTRYEFAIAIKRLLDKLPAGQGTVGPPGPKGDKGDPGDPPAGLNGNFATKEELAAVSRLVDEFRPELSALKTDVAAVKARLDAAEKSIVDINDRLNKLPKFGGSFFVGVRTDEARSTYSDYGGATRTANHLLGNADVVHDFHLTVTAPVNGDGKFYGDLAFSNYLGGYRGGTLSTAAFANNIVKGTSTESVLPYVAELTLPLKFGKESALTLGRYRFQISPGIYQRPDLDPYFHVDAYDDGNFIQDGFKLQTGFGSFKTEIFAASFASVNDTQGNNINQPLVGNLGNTRFGKPLNINTYGKQTTANQVAGVNFTVPLLNIGELGATAVTFATDSPIAGSSNVTVLGGFIKPKPFGRFYILAEGAKSINSDKLTNLGNGELNGNEDNLYGNVNVGYASGPVKATAGYIYVDPNYSAPGNWLKIGNWYNPTNVRGPYVDLGYNLSKGLSINFVGNILEGAHNRASLGQLNISDNIYRAKAGLAYTFSRGINVGVDYEGVFYELSTASSASGNKAKPIEQYITLSTGLNIANNTVLKLGYQLLNFQNVGGGFANTPNSSNANVFTTQLQVKF